jgi:hypothetical protein
MMWKQITVMYSGTEIITYLDSTEVLRELVSPQRRKRSTETPVNITLTIGGKESTQTSMCTCVKVNRGY